MSARKLSDSEKKDILHLYRTTGETSSSLAVKYEVSTSTVSRLLKSTLPANEYEGLIQQKRSPRSAEFFSEAIGDDPISPAPELSGHQSIQVEPLQVEQLTLEDVEQPVATLKTGRSAPIRRRSTQAESPEVADPSPETATPVPELPKPKKVIVLPKVSEQIAADAKVEAFSEGEVLKEILSDSLLEEDEETDLDEDDLDDLDDLDDDLEDDEDDLDEDGSETPLLTSGRLKAGTVVRVLPFAEAPIPRTCYLVVDRSAELIAPPLREFGDLGQIPEEEVQAKTLPVFDNHRIAKRYSNPRTQRVIKLPDGKVLSKTFSHLQAKGITRLLIDGRVYSL